MKRIPWWITSLMIAVAAMIYAVVLFCLPFGIATAVWLIGGLVFAFVLLRDPSRFYRRMFTSVLSTWCFLSAIPAFQLDIWIVETLNVNFCQQPPSTSFHVVAVALMIVLLILDFFARREAANRAELARKEADRSNSWFGWWTTQPELDDGGAWYSIVGGTVATLGILAVVGATAPVTGLLAGGVGTYFYLRGQAQADERQKQSTRVIWLESRVLLISVIVIALLLLGTVAQQAHCKPVSVPVQPQAIH